MSSAGQDLVEKGEKKKTESQASQEKSTHPTTANMVNAAIGSLKERNGSSLQAIKKYIAVNYQVDLKKVAPLIRKYLKSAVTSGTLIQTTGKGAMGSFKLATTTTKKASENKAPEPKTSSSTKTKKETSKTNIKKSHSPKKPKSPKKDTTSNKKEKSKPKSTKAKSKTEDKKSNTKKTKLANGKKDDLNKSPKKRAPKKKVVTKTKE